MKSEEVISTREFQEFIKSCRNYCQFLEENDIKDSTAYFIDIQNLLVDLYAKAVTFRTVDLDYSGEFDKDISKEDIEKIEKQTGEMIGQYQFYWTIFNPTDDVYGEKDPVLGDLLDDLMDIYQNIKHRLLVLDINTIESREEAVWGLNFDFWNHWGFHAIDAMRTIHYVLEKTEKYK